MQQVTQWIASLANYNFALNYQSGKMNVDADALSHIPKREHDQHIEAASVHALISAGIAQLVEQQTFMQEVPVSMPTDS